ncbi:hypothetical protein HN51_016835 [Arachis hypogaea]|uniref:EF-hand domain-containing protein n=1 Tax=Arachis hypogaea TaxID=3818 RepID=A0A445CUS8_ARAHY|nr:probable calcium-binding protein CML22 [Arachis hypogaea]QHO47450.1 putative calcium-binding protein [Arachis hypogaea]RYR54664.1 hypothetical protein Ahy_A06g029974 [Arachis hypogaea]
MMASLFWNPLSFPFSLYNSSAPYFSHKMHTLRNTQNTIAYLGLLCLFQNLFFSGNHHQIFFTQRKMGAICCCGRKPSKGNSLDRKLERKIIEMRKNKFGKSKLKSIDSVVMLFPMFREKLKTLRGMFEQYDEDSNGYIDPNELKRFLEHQQFHLQEEEFETLFRYCDIDGSKGIQFNEFIVLVCLIHLLQEQPSFDSSSKAELANLGEVFDNMIEVFLFFDKNADGKINKKDMVKTLNDTYPLEKSPSHITEKRFKEMDWDNNGQVTIREFLFGFIKWVGIDADE